jgi:hypothetical protein
MEGGLADKSSQLILDALSRAVADPGGLPLHATKKAPGLFATTATGKQAALRCQQDGLLSSLHVADPFKTSSGVFTITEKGLAFLLSQVSPKKVLEDLVQTLKARNAQVGELVAAAKQWQLGLDALQGTVAKVLQEMQKPGGTCAGPAPSANGSDLWLTDVVAFLAQRQSSGATDDCSLPDLFRRAQQLSPKLSLGAFHDGLRRLHDQERIYLHPWTGPLYDLPEPACALLVGHEIAYYASVRRS